MSALAVEYVRLQVHKTAKMVVFLSSSNWTELHSSSWHGSISRGRQVPSGGTALDPRTKQEGVVISRRQPTSSVGVTILRSWDPGWNSKRSLVMNINFLFPFSFLFPQQIHIINLWVFISTSFCYVSCIPPHHVGINLYQFRILLWLWKASPSCIGQDSAWAFFSF